MWAHLRTRGILAPQNDVRLGILAYDPEGVSRRRRRRLRRRKYFIPGPNYVWHIDGHDKLKPYGFCFHGCIDGFSTSRIIIWLEVSSSNKKPELIARYYLDAVEQLGGSGHAIIQPIHIYFYLIS